MTGRITVTIVQLSRNVYYSWRKTRGWKVSCILGHLHIFKGAYIYCYKRKIHRFVYIQKEGGYNLLNMPTLSNASDYDEDEHDIVAEYENQESDEGDQGNVARNAASGSENEGCNEEAENEENTARRVDPSTSKKRIVRNPLPKLNTERLKGPKGIHTIEKYFDGFKFHDHGNEKVDLDRVMKRLEHWGHRLFPKLQFDDFLDRLEKLGSKKDLQVFVKKYRLDMLNEDNDIIDQVNTDEEEDKAEEEPVDEFDLLIAEQIKLKQTMQQSSSDLSVTNNENAFDKLLSQANTTNASQSATTKSTASQLSDEVKERIERNRQQAIQRRLAKLKEKEEEIKRRKLEEAEGVQPEINKSINLGNEDLENNSQETNTMNLKVIP